MNINQILDGGPAAAPKSAEQLLQQKQQQQQIFAQQQHERHRQHLQQKQQQQHLPLTPVQNIPPQAFHDYNQHHQTSPSSRQPSHSYASHPMPPGAHPMPPGAFASPPPPYQNPFPGRPAPPPLQPLQSNEVRSPSIASVAVPSPYRHTPGSSISASAGGGFPFPPPQQNPTSPLQRHQYPPSGAYPPRESYSQLSGPASATGPPGPPSYSHGGALPQTPPVGTASVAHPYAHQRSQSAHSTPTPTSAHSQHQYGGAAYVHGSPIAAAQQHPPPPMDHHARHQSQPPTPLGPPLSGPRQLSVPPSHAQPQPPSPYQQRVSASVGQYHHPSQGSAAPPAPPPIQRAPSDHLVYDPPQPHPQSHPHPQPNDPRRTSHSHSQSERERSLSVSPKTRIPSLSSSTGQTAISQPDIEPRHPHLRPTPGMPSAIEPDRERAVTPAKRKLDDRDLKLEELERRETRPAPFEGVNGSHVPGHASSQASQASTSPIMPRKKRTRYNNPPIWATRQTKDGRLKAINFVLRKVVHHHVGQVNGKPERTSSRQPSPEERRSVPAAQPAAAAPPGPPAPANADGPLGPWESSITGKRPYEDMAKTVADFLYVNVLHNPDIGEISSRDVQFEIEAKLGTLISKDTNDRVNIPVTTECVLFDNGRVAFRSSMTEVSFGPECHQFTSSSLRSAAHPSTRSCANRPCSSFLFSGPTQIIQ